VTGEPERKTKKRAGGLGSWKGEEAEGETNTSLIEKTSWNASWRFSYRIRQTLSTVVILRKVK